MTLQALGGVNSPCDWYRVREGSPSLLEVTHTHTHTHTPTHPHTQRRVWSADGAVCDDITPCLIGSKMVGLGGAIFTSSRHLSAPLWQKKHRPCALSWSGVAAGVAQVPNWLLPSQQWQRCQCDALMMHRTLNSLINTINDNYFLVLTT